MSANLILEVCAMSRRGMPMVSESGQDAVQGFADMLREKNDLSMATVRNYLSDIRHFIAWCEVTWSQEGEEPRCYSPLAVATPTITEYRAYLQTREQLKPASINRTLISLKRYFSWLTDQGVISRNPAQVVKLVNQVLSPPRHLTDQEENALIASVTMTGSLRDRTILLVLLHTGLRAREICELKRSDVHVNKRSGYISVYGKRRKYREVPLNATARAALQEYLETGVTESPILFPSEKTGEALTARALGYAVKKYAGQARVSDVSPHCLRHRFGYRMAQSVPLHRLAQIMGHDSLHTTMIYIQGTRSDLQKEVEKIAWT